jgi:cell division protein FtsN
MSKKAQTEAVASKARADKLFQQTKAKNKALLDQSTKTQAGGQTAPAPRRPRPKPQPAAELPTPPRPAMRAGQGSDSAMSFPESEERAFILDGGAFLGATVSLLLLAAARDEEDDEGEAE